MIRWPGVSAKLCVFALLLASCGSVDTSPRQIVDGEGCENCRMTVDRPQYAAQLVEVDGSRRIFDHPVCMVRYIVGRSAGEPEYEQRIAERYVADFYSRDWLPADSAAYAVHPSIPTVMDFGVVAAKRHSGRALADSVGGELLTYAALVDRYGN